jgi:hypothetical protein
MILSRLKLVGFFTLICMVGLGGLTGCGKRGDPVRPADVEQAASN